MKLWIKLPAAVYRSSYGDEVTIELPIYGRSKKSGILGWGKGKDFRKVRIANHSQPYNRRLVQPAGVLLELMAQFFEKHGVIALIDPDEGDLKLLKRMKNVVAMEREADDHTQWHLYPLEFLMLDRLSRDDDRQLIEHGDPYLTWENEVLNEARCDLNTHIVIDGEFISPEEICTQCDFKLDRVAGICKPMIMECQWFQVIKKNQESAGQLVNWFGSRRPLLIHLPGDLEKPKADYVTREAFASYVLCNTKLSGNETLEENKKERREIAQRAADTRTIRRYACNHCELGARAYCSQRGGESCFGPYLPDGSDWHYLADSCEAWAMHVFLWSGEERRAKNYIPGWGKLRREQYLGYPFTRAKDEKMVRVMHAAGDHGQGDITYKVFCELIEEKPRTTWQEIKKMDRGIEDTLLCRTFVHLFLQSRGRSWHQKYIASGYGSTSANLAYVLLYPGSDTFTMTYISKSGRNYVDRIEELRQLVHGHEWNYDTRCNRFIDLGDRKAENELYRQLLLQEKVRMPFDEFREIYKMFDDWKKLPIGQTISRVRELQRGGKRSKRIIDAPGQGELEWPE